MRYGVCICGLNGSGKTTLARNLAEKLNFKLMDVEDYYFSSSDNPYLSSKTWAEVEQMLLADIKENPCFVFSSVNGNKSAEISSYYDLVIYLEVPLDVRMKRIKQRAVDRFGDRVLTGGDMHEQEERFFEFASKRTPEVIEAWLDTVFCKVLRLDGTKPVCELVDYIIHEMT